MQAMTDWREYRIGEVPQDWALIGDSIANTNTAFTGFNLCGSPYPNRVAYLQPSMGGDVVTQTGSGYWWTALDSAPDRQYHEILIRFRHNGTNFCLLVNALSDNTAYALQIDTTTGVRFGSVSAVGTYAALSASSFTVADGIEYYVRFGVHTSAGLSYMRCKVWDVTASEPAYQDYGPVTAPSALGRPGIAGHTGGQAGPVFFCSVASGDGVAAPLDSQLPPTLATIISDPSYNLAMTYEIEMCDRDGGNPDRRYFATQTFFCGPTDFPARKTMPGIVKREGSIKINLSEEQLFAGLADQQVDNIKLRNDVVVDSGVVDYIATKSVQGKHVTYRVGDANNPSHRSYTVLMSAQLDGEPILSPDQVELQVASPLRRLEQNIAVQRYIGISTAFYGRAATAVQSYYAVSLFTACVRWKGTMSAAQDIFAHGTNFNINVSANGQTVVASCSGVVSLTGTIDDRTAVGFPPSTSWHWAAFGVDGLGYAYLVIDGIKVAEALGLGAVTTTTAALTLGVPSSETNALTMDFRLYGYKEPDVISTLMAQRSANTEADTVGLWVGDDATGTTVTDYSTNASHATGLTGAFSTSDEGTEQYAGQVKPIILGQIWNGPTAAIDNLRPRFGAGSGGTVPTMQNSDLAAYSRGVAVTPTTSPTTADVIGFATAQSEPITYRITPTLGTSPYSNATPLPKYVTEILARCGVPNFIRTPTIVGDGGGLDTMRWNVGNVITDEKTAAELLTQLLAPVGGGFYYTSEGDPAPVYMLPPAGSPRDSYDKPVLELLPLSTDSTSALGVAKLRVASGGLSSHDNSYAFWIKPFSTCDYSGLDSGWSDRCPISPLFKLKRLKPVDGALIELGGVSTAPASSALRFGQWYFVAVTSVQATGAVNLYVGRKGSTPGLIATFAGAATGFAAADYAALGGVGTFAAISELSIWNKVLNASEVAALMLAAPTVGTSNLVNYYPFDDGPLSTTVTDRVTLATCRLAGARWTPRLKIDIGAQGDTQLLIRKLRPAWNASIGWRKNFRVLTTAELSAAAVASDASIMKNASVGADYPDRSIRAAFLDSRVVDLGDSLVTAQSHAKEICYRLRQRFSPNVELVTLQNGFRDLMLLRPNDEFWLKYPRYGLDSGAAYRVVGVEVDLGTTRVSLTLLGDGERFAGEYLIIDQETGEKLVIDQSTGELLTI